MTIIDRRNDMIDCDLHFQSFDPHFNIDYCAIPRLLDLIFKCTHLSCEWLPSSFSMLFHDLPLIPLFISRNKALYRCLCLQKNHCILQPYFYFSMSFSFNSSIRNFITELYVKVPLKFTFYTTNFYATILSQYCYSKTYS